MRNRLKAQHHECIKAILAVFTGCLFLCVSAIDISSHANEKYFARVRHLNTPKIRADLPSQKRIYRGLKPNIKDRKMGPGLKKYISQQVSGKDLSAVETHAVGNQGMIRIILKTSNMTDDFANRIHPYDAKVVKRKSGLVIVEVPRTRAEEMINEVDEIEYARQPFVFFPLGEVSEGVHLSGADIFHDNGFTGSGVKVAVIDVGF